MLGGGGAGGKNEGVASASSGVQGGLGGTLVVGGGILTANNMGNVMGPQGQAAAAAAAAGGGLKGAAAASGVGAAAGGKGYGLGGTAAGVARNKLGLSSKTTNANPLMPRGNPTGGGGALGTNFMPLPRGPFVGQQQQRAGQALPGGAAPVGKQQSSFLAKPRPKIPTTTALAPNTAASSHVNVAPRRPFAGKVTVAADGSNKGHQKHVTIPKCKQTAAAAAAEVAVEKVPIESTSAPHEVLSLVGIDIVDEAKEVQPLIAALAIRDIDCNDDSPQLVSEYINDITDYLFKLEKKYILNEKYLDGTQLNGRMRAVLLDWLVQVHLQFAFKQETLYIATNVMDRFLQMDHTIPRQHLQLVGVASTYIAVKYEEISMPCLQDFSSVADGAFSTKELIQMEARILKTLGFDLAPPIPPFFLRRCSKAASADITLHQVAKFIMELAAIDYASCHLRPSLMAAASLGLAMMILKKLSLALLWSPTIQHYSRYKIKDVKPAIILLANVLAAAYDDAGKLMGVRKKFSSAKMYRVSTLNAVVPANWKPWLFSSLNQL